MAVGDIFGKTGSVSVDGNGVVQASRKIHRDISQAVQWVSALYLARTELIPRDHNGTPYRLCSEGHYSPIAAFNKDKSRRDGYDPYCRACRHVMVERARGRR